MSAAAFFRYLGLITAGSALYLALALLGTGLAIPPGNVTPVYPVAGLGFGAYLVFGRKILPAIFIGSFFANLISIDHELELAVIYACGIISTGVVLSTLIAGGALLRVCKLDQILETPRGVLMFFGVSALWVVSPSFGVTALCLHELLDWQAYSFTWLTWWLGDAIGVMLVAPLVLLFRSRAELVEVRGHVFKLALFLACYVTLIMGLSYSPWPVAFLLLPATIIFVLHFEILGAALASVISGLLIIVAVLIGGRMYQNFDLSQRLLLLQVLVGVNSFTGYFLAAHVRTIKQLTDSVSKARRDSEHDVLTGLLNRRGFGMYSAQILKQARQHDRGLSLLMIDLDNFKYVNDNFGHDTGDIVLRDFAGLLKKILRANDIAARIGGEEFVLLLETTNITELEKISSRLLQAARELRFFEAPAAFQLTVSGGVALTTEFSDLEKLLKAADDRLYIAKRAGKNQIVWP